MQQTYSLVQAGPDAIFVAAAPFYTSAGVATGTHLFLSLVKTDCGSVMVLAVARNPELYTERFEPVAR